MGQCTGFGQLSGTVIDSLTNGKMPFASVIIEQNGKEIAGVQTSQNGVFNTKKLPCGKYSLRVQYLGYKAYNSFFTIEESDVSLVPIKLTIDQINLSEVKVVGKKPFIEQSIDKMILNVSESITGAG